MQTTNLHCPSCDHDVEVQPQRCPLCGALLAPARKPRGASPVLVIFLLFCVLGPLALGLLWRNDHFSLTSKIILTVIVGAITVFVFWYVYGMYSGYIEQMERAMQGFQMP